jgi:Domain of unknown function (DUF4288)
MYWFWAWTVLATTQKDKLGDPKARCEVWENLIILHARTPREALRKAEKVGRADAGDCRGTLRLDGKPALCKFLGVASLGLIHDGLIDGAEITWRLRRCSQSAATKSLTSRATIIAKAEKEFGHVQRAATPAI